MAKRKKGNLKLSVSDIVNSGQASSANFSDDHSPRMWRQRLRDTFRGRAGADDFGALTLNLIRAVADNKVTADTLKGIKSEFSRLFRPTKHMPAVQGFQNGLTLMMDALIAAQTEGRFRRPIVHENTKFPGVSWAPLTCGRLDSDKPRPRR